jgi:hypothetical protein
MSPLLSVPFVLRPRRSVLLCLGVVVVTAAGGCSHSRSAMRPVFVSPAPAPATTVTADPCPTTIEGGTAIEPGGGSVSSEVVAPGGPSGGLTSPPARTAPPAGSGAASPPRPAPPADEPGLQLEPTDPPSASKNAPPALQRPAGPTSSRNGQSSGSLRIRETGLRQRVRPFVNDPDDLFSPPKADRPWKYVVLHHSAKETGNYDEIDREHRKVLGLNGCGYHFVIGNGTGSPDGQIAVAMRWSEQKHGVHCKNGKNADVNEYGIGICLVGDLDREPPTARQIASTRALIAYLTARYQIPAANVETHAHLASSPTKCPGKLFPADQILSSASVATR